MFKLTLLACTVSAGLAAVTTAQAYDRHIELVNESHEAITRFYASNVGTNDWQEDILGRGVLPAGYHVLVNLDDGSRYCRFDFKTVFSDGTAVIRRNVDVCAIAKYTLTD